MNAFGLSGRLHYAAPPDHPQNFGMIATALAAARALTLALAVIFLQFLLLPRAAASTEVDFETQIKPIFERRCYDCHGLSKRKGGLRLTNRKAAFRPGNYGVEVIVPGDADLSFLYELIRSSDPKERMPRKREALTTTEIDLIGRWIDEGADWPENSSAASHWAYRPPIRPALPEPASGSASTNPIDLFVDQALEGKGLARNPRAEPATLLRRLYLDMIGLPPTPEQVAAFVADPSENAWSQAVDSLFESKHYGERWAIPWLDLARYADSDGHQRDLLRSTWPYRDWVVGAINADLPFDQFTIEQLAGDLLPRSRFDQQIATGFQRATKTNLEVGVDPEEDRMAQVIDRANTTAAVWLGTTFECAQCHDHKFEPISQREYYAFLAFFNNTALETKPIVEGGVALQSAGPALFLPNDENFKTRQASRVAQLTTEADRIKSGLAKDSYWTWRERMARLAERPTRWRVPDLAEFRSTGEVGQQVLADGSVLLSDPPPGEVAHTFEFTTDLARVTALQLEILDDPGQSAAAAASPVLLSEFRLSFPSEDGRPKPTRVYLWSGAPETGELIDPLAHHAIDGSSGTDWAVLARSPSESAKRAVFFTDQAPASPRRLIVEFQHDNLKGGSVRHFRLSVTADDTDALALPPELLAFLREGGTAGPLEKSLREFHAKGGVEVRRRIPRLLNELGSDAPASSLVLRELHEARETHLLERGNFLSPGERVDPGTPLFLHDFPPELPRNRLGLARWLVDARNPLMARVTVNGWWTELFGAGLVRTPEDFGVRGERPSHPELLDWLSLEFRENGWSRRQMLRLMVLSETYRQSSALSQEALASDPDNRLLARAARRRLPAELVRDNALALSGLLSETVGGPPAYPFQPADLWRLEGAFSLRYQPDTDSNRFRRGLYVVRRRSAPYPSFTNFDAPDHNVCALRRPETNTPLQALTLLNDKAYVEMAFALAERILRETPGQPTAQRLRHALRLALAREARPAEIGPLQSLLETEQARVKAEPDQAVTLLRGIKGWRAPDDLDPAELAAWFFVANAILNLDETFTRI